MPPTPDRPNVLLVLCDQLRRPAIGGVGGAPKAAPVETPTIDGHAERGVQFTNACSTNPACVRARFALLTEQPSHFRMVRNVRRSSPTE